MVKYSRSRNVRRNSRKITKKSRRTYRRRSNRRRSITKKSRRTYRRRSIRRRSNRRRNFKGGAEDVASNVERLDQRVEILDRTIAARLDAVTRLWSKVVGRGGVEQRLDEVEQLCGLGSATRAKGPRSVAFEPDGSKSIAYHPIEPEPQPAVSSGSGGGGGGGAAADQDGPR